MICCFLFALSISGCGKEKVDYVREDSTSSEETIAPIITLGEQYNIPKSWEADDVNKNANINIEADIIVPEIGGMNVYGVSRVSYDATMKKDIIGKLSVDTVYKYDMEYYTKDMILPYLERIETIMEDAEANGDYTNNPELEEGHYEEYERYYALYENAPDELIPVDDYENSCFLVDYNDMEYELYINDYGIELTLLEKHIEAYGAEKEYEYGIYIDYDSTVPNAEDNKSSLTEENATNDALRFIDMLGLGDFGVIDINPAYYTGVGEVSDDTWYNGYTIVLGRELDGIVLDSYQLGARENSDINSASDDIPLLQFEFNNTLNWENGEYPRMSHNIERIYVTVTDYGVIYFYYNNPLQIDTVMGENVELLSFERIQNSAEDIFYNEPFYNDITIDGFMVTSIKLTYFPYKDEEESGDIAIIPVWCFNNINDNVTLMINAIDGTMIDMGQQLYEIYNFID